VEGADAEAVLNRICANDIAVNPCRVVYTQWLNERGGIEADLTVTRESERRFLVVTAAASQARDFAWLRRHIPEEARAVALDVTSAYAVLGVMGPHSRDLLARLTADDLSDVAFPFGASREIDLAMARVRATRITYVGELGWELYIPAEFAVGVYDALVAEGAAVRLHHAGYHAMNSLRMEKAYRHWGHDIADEDTPLEAGLSFAVAWDKPDGFIGRDALLRQKAAGVRRRLALFALEDERPLLYHNEPIWRDGQIVGRITSGMFGHTTQRSLGMGYVENVKGNATPEFVMSGRYEIEIADTRVPARVSLRPAHDPDGHRIRG
jgi:glycine cleavage system aminomethyltransferase T